MYDVIDSSIVLLILINLQLSFEKEIMVMRFESGMLS